MGVDIVGGFTTVFGKFPDASLKELGAAAIDGALADAEIDRQDVDLAFVANSMASLVTGQTSVVGQTVLRADGFSSIPVFNIDNACAGGSSAVYLGAQAIESGQVDCVLVLGVEKLVHEEKWRSFRSLNGAADPELAAGSGVDLDRASFFVSEVYPRRVDAYSREFGLDPEALAEIAVKNRWHASMNESAQYRQLMTTEDVLSSREVLSPITALMCAPISDGAAAVVLMRRQSQSSSRAVGIRGIAVGMGSPDGGSIERAGRRAFAQAGIGAHQVDLAELHDSISFNELTAYEDLGFCGRGEGGEHALTGVTKLGGALPVNTSGGLESRGHPVAATSVAQLVELTTQLRGEAGDRQVSGARVAVAENAGGFAKDDTAALCVTVLGV